jgi:hypothetical protein
MTPEQTLDWLAEQHKSQCNEDRPVQEWIRSMKSMLPAPVQEPVVFYRCNGCGHAYEQVHPTSCDCMEAGGFDRVEYYTTPPAAQRQSVGLTVDELITLEQKHRRHEDLSRAIEAKLKEKNNG